MTQEAQKRPLNRLQSMYALRAHVDKMYQAGRQAEKEGRPVAWVMLEGWASPILSAMEIKAVFPENYGTICAASGAAAPFLERAEAEGFPGHLCGYARNCLGYTAMMTELGETPPQAPGEGLPKPTFLVSSGAVCDARFKWFQALGRYLDVPMWTLEQPNPGSRESLMEGAHERNVSFLVKELKEFVGFLEKLVGGKMDWDILEEKRQRANRMNTVWYEANDLRSARPGPMHSRDFWSSMSGSLYGGAEDYQELADLYGAMYDEVKSRVDNKIAGINREEKYRVIFDGLPPWHSLGFFDMLADRGWNFVTESVYHPPKPLPVDLSPYSDPVERYVRSRYHGLSTLIDSEFEPEEAARVKDEIMRTGVSRQLTAKVVRDFQCDGAVLHTLLTCRGTTAPLLRVGSMYQEVWKVPYLVIEGDIVDLTLFDSADALRKAEVFEETMDHYKKVRQEAGLEW